MNLAFHWLSPRLRTTNLVAEGTVSAILKLKIPMKATDRATAINAFAEILPLTKYVPQEAPLIPRISTIPASLSDQTTNTAQMKLVTIIETS